MRFKHRPDRAQLDINDLRTDGECMRVVQRIANKIVRLRNGLDRFQTEKFSLEGLQKIEIAKKTLLEYGKRAIELNETTTKELRWSPESRGALDELRDDVNRLGRDIKTIM